ncbi:DUF1642 domain-containing protein [Enterococcus faecalis]|uniref:DUF1642 domain-containing protein n=1 Tax=Enterococcus faecalis TaxID=1351 RepID=UPI001929FCAE|nr:DUF1642 domain-containing protein [Enterococcus faecalis]MBW7792708.1 DUF1642 domain-containing protein [Enterococcus faecalis]
MNKQELIETLEEIRANIDRDIEIGDRTIFSRGEKNAYNNAIGLAKQLDEPKKVVVPKFVAEWIELYKKENKTTLWHVMNKIINEKFLNHQNIVIWFENDSNKHILEQAWVNGYEVEKEQLYKVVIDHKYLVQLFSGRTDARLVEYEELTNWHDSAYKLTESVIKAIDERYWPFAVKVEG